jgi:hypothetical protein
VSGFENVIRGFANQSLWVSLDYDGDGSWILEGMLAQSLIIIHAGSYMKEISPIISSAATMIYYTIAKVQCKCTWAKMSTSAGSYHGKILGGIMMQLLLHATAASASYHGALLPSWTVITTTLFSMEITLLDHSLPTNLKRTSFKSSRTLSLPRHSESNISTSHHMLMIKNGRIVPLKRA